MRFRTPKRVTVVSLLFFSLVALTHGGSAGIIQPAFADPDIPDLPELDIMEIVPQAAVGEIIKTLGILTKHRPFQGGGSLGKTMEFGIEASLVHLPSSFGPTLSDLGMGDISGLESAALPMAKIHLHKGLGPKTDFGASGLYYPGFLLWGVHMKFVLFEPEEGALWAFRVGYSETSFDLSKVGLRGLPIRVGGVDVGQGNLKLATRTITPEILVAKRFEFAEPYLGAGVEFTSGQIEVPVTIHVLPEEQLLRTPAARSTQVALLSGVAFRVPYIGLRLGLEGAYGSLGMHRLGLILGFSF